MIEPDDETVETDLGHPGMDAEHRGQLELMNRLEAALASGRPASELVGELARLVAYLDAHFLSEQVAMRELAYPDYDEHVREHDRAISLLRELKSRCDAGDARMTAERLAALRGWLLAHIQTTDRKLVEFMVSQGVLQH